jgi:geranylgeranylglycerol-phosphate geranylgeranyltransferase
MSARPSSVWRRAGQLCVSISEVTRLRNSVLGAAYTFLGAYLASDLSRVVSGPVVISAVVVLLVVACGYVTNDYRDAAADAIAKPARPIPSGRLSRQAAGWLAVGLGLGAIAIASALGPGLTAFAVATVVLSVGYSYLLKEIPLVGNASVGLLTGAILVYGGLAAGAITPAVAVACAMAGLFIFAQEIFYTVEDEAGDRAGGVRTTATSFGRRVALRMFRALALLFVIVAILPWYLGLASAYYLYAVIVLTIAPTVGLVVLLSAATVTDRTIAVASRLSRVVWWSSVPAMALLK